jgi:hypothetical protein
MKYLYIFITLAVIAMLACTGCTKIIHVDNAADSGSGIIQFKTPTPTPTSPPVRQQITEVPTVNVTEAPIIIRGSLLNVTVFIDPKSPTLEIGQEYSWIRENASMFKNLSAHFKVYRTVALNGYTWHSFSDGKDYYQTNEIGYVWLFVFIQFYLDDYAGHGDRMWIPDPDTSIAINYEGRTIRPDTTYNPVNLIKEMESYKNANDDSLVKPYDYTITYSPAYNLDGDCSFYDSGKTAFWYNCNYPESGGYTANITGLLMQGKSNAEDGYVIFKVPQDWMDKDTKVITSLYTFGSPSWEIGTVTNPAIAISTSDTGIRGANQGSSQ